MNEKNFLITSSNTTSITERRELFVNFKTNNDLDARNKLITDNLYMVHKIIMRKFNNTNYNYDDLFEIGVFGLIKAVDTFNLEKNKYFSQNAIKYISRSIESYIKKENKKGKKDKVSLNEIKNNESNYNYIYYIDEYQKYDIEELLNNLDEEEKLVVILYFGLSNNPIYNQQEIAEIINTSQQNVSLILKKALTKLKNNYNKNVDKKKVL